MKSSHKTVLVILISFVISGVVDEYFLISFVISGVVDEYFLITQGVKELTFVPHTFFVAICLFIWCKQHGAENGNVTLKMYPLLCAFIGIIGIPVYAYRFYGFNKGSILLLKGLAAFVLTAFIAFGATTLFSKLYV